MSSPFPLIKVAESSYSIVGVHGDTFSSWWRFMQIDRDSRFEIPPALHGKLLSFRRRLWWVKLLEAIAAAVVGVLLGFLLTYVLDRLFDTPRWLRGAIFTAAVLSCAAVPIAIDRWVWRRRRIDQLAHLLAQTHPAAGDQLLGVIHLSEDATEQARSPALVQAAIRQVSESVAAQDLSQSIPHPRHRQRGFFALALASLSLMLLVLTASAATNAWARFLAPWGDTPRYTFAAVEPLPESMIVPHGEPFELTVALQESTRWMPATAGVHIAGQTTQQANVAQSHFHFSIPGQIVPLSLGVQVGDFRGNVAVEPMLRPELAQLRAEIRLPSYLQRTELVEREIRGASMTAVRGSRVVLNAGATRPLADVRVNGQSRPAEGEHFATEVTMIDQSREIELQWQDQYGLSGKEPLKILIEAIDDEPPSLICENLPRRKVVLENEVISFQIRAHDDFGVKRVGIDWQAIDDRIEDASGGESSHQSILGEAILGGGNAQATSLELAAAFSARDHGIKPQTIAVRVFVEDFFPDRERVYSPLCVFDVLDPSQHAIWVTSELGRWHRMSLDVRDREMQLHETNKTLRDLSAELRAAPEQRQRLEQQADQEQTNARRLANLVHSGEGLLREAMRNSEVGAENLEHWAEMIQVLKEISESRMPSVAELLKQAALAQAAQHSPATPQEKPNADSQKVGQNRLTQTADPTNESADMPADSADAKPPVPSISDIESSQHDLSSVEHEQKQDSPSQQQGRLTLPDTKLAGDAPSQNQPPQDIPKVEQAVVEQAGLLAEFEKVADDLNDVLANLEGSTLVKRLKASSRKQQQVAAGLASLVSDAFGVPDRDKRAEAASFAEFAEAESDSSREVSNIMDDMSAYFERSRMALLLHVLDDMKEQDVTASLRSLSDELRAENGLSIAQAEYWSDALDRWAEDLVEVTQSASSPGGKVKGSLPPSVVLEVLQLLDGEVTLRELTRVAEQSRTAVGYAEHVETANRLGELQNEYQQRVEKVAEQILELPNARGDFADELGMLSEVSEVMKETTEILYKPETGPRAIAAETDIIEMLLRSTRFNPNASGGSGADPGGGGDGETEVAALALVGAGINAKEVREEMPTVQSTGTTGPGLPEEFRTGLDRYFNRLESWKSQ